MSVLTIDERKKKGILKRIFSLKLMLDVRAYSEICCEVGGGQSLGKTITEIYSPPYFYSSTIKVILKVTNVQLVSFHYFCTHNQYIDYTTCLGSISYL